MASKPGLLTDWPWKPLGNLKYAILLPWVVRSTYLFFSNGPAGKGDVSNFMVFPFLLSRMLHNQLWITISRHRTAKGTSRIVDKGLEFDQVDRESNWDDNILFNGILIYVFQEMLTIAQNLPPWRNDGIILTILLHSGPVEFLYYWLHRALHHHYLYSRYHSHHHSSIVTQPITSVIHPFAEHIVYFILFSIPMFATLLTKTVSMASLYGYITYIDLMNNMGHCNFELIPKRLFSILPPLKYLLYTPSYHSLHHTQFRTNYSLFMPFYDYIYGTMDKSTNTLHETSLDRKEDSPDVVYLTCLDTPMSIYHLRLGFASMSSNPYEPTWYLWLMWPVTMSSMIIAWIYGKTFILERNTFKNLKLQTWTIPSYRIQYSFGWSKENTNTLIEEAIIDAEAKGAKVLSLGFTNQDEEVNKSAENFVQTYPKLNIKLVDGSSLMVAIVLNSIPNGTTQVLIRGKLSKVAISIASILCEKGIKVAVKYEDDYVRLKQTMMYGNNLILTKNYIQKIWLVGDEVSDEEQRMALTGTLFIPYSMFPPKKIRNDCAYKHTPAMLCPPKFENLHSCENSLPRRAMSAPRVAGLLHCLEGWSDHECGRSMLNFDKVWKSSLNHGFRPLNYSRSF